MKSIESLKRKFIKDIKKHGILATLKDFDKKDYSSLDIPIFTPPVVVNELFSKFDLEDSIALNYFNSVGIYNENLANLGLSKTIRKQITIELVNGLKMRYGRYEIEREISKNIDDDLELELVKTIVKTELTYAYSHAKIDILLDELKLFNNAQGYIKIETSPIHNQEDLCDILQGTYKVEAAPIPPFHFGCDCSVSTYFEPKSKHVEFTTIEKQLKKLKVDPDIDFIETTGGKFVLKNK